MLGKNRNKDMKTLLETNGVRKNNNENARNEAHKTPEPKPSLIHQFQEK